VRELRNILESAAILCDGGLITPDHLALAPPLQRSAIGQGASAAGDVALEPVSASSAAADVAIADAVPPSAPAVHHDLKSVERLMVEKALADARYNKSRAAKALGLTRAQLYVRMRRHGL
jgi:DNA-binding NtrC family response regulator